MRGIYNRLLEPEQGGQHFTVWGRGHFQVHSRAVQVCVFVCVCDTVTFVGYLCFCCYFFFPFFFLSVLSIFFVLKFVFSFCTELMLHFYFPSFFFFFLFVISLVFF